MKLSLMAQDVSKISKVLLWASAGIYVAGFFAAFLLGKLLIGGSQRLSSLPGLALAALTVVTYASGDPQNRPPPVAASESIANA
jgi:hypothetical protein